MTTVAPSTSGDDSILPPIVNNNEAQAVTSTTTDFKDSRHSVSKEQWRNLLEQFVQHQEDQDFPDEVAQTSFVRSESDFSAEGHKHRASATTSTVVGAATVATGAGTAAELNELNRDLEDTADNLADLEIEFTEELQTISMGISSAFEQWNASEHDMMTVASVQFFRGQ